MHKQISKRFDCVASKNKAQARIARDLAGMDTNAQLAYFESKAIEGDLGDWWAAVRAGTTARAIETGSKAAPSPERKRSRAGRAGPCIAKAPGRKTSGRR